MTIHKKIVSDIRFFIVAFQKAELCAVHYGIMVTEKVIQTYPLALQEPEANILNRVVYFY
jgi:hypothetical protein